jgi:uncharacterized protein YjbJ (UPF0337 family)
LFCADLVLHRFCSAPPAGEDRLISNELSNEGGTMGFLDRWLGRGKKAAGEVAGDASLRREGAAQERQAVAEERAEQHEELAQEARRDAAEEEVRRDTT